MPIVSEIITLEENTVPPAIVPAVDLSSDMGSTGRYEGFPHATKQNLDIVIVSYTFSPARRSRAVRNYVMWF